MFLNVTLTLSNVARHHELRKCENDRRMSWHYLTLEGAGEKAT